MALSNTIVPGNTTVSLATLLPIPATHPAYLILNALDRNEYTAAATGATGTIKGNGATMNLSSIGDDGRGAGIVFTWQASTGQYVNATFGNLSQLTYTAPASANDLTSLSLFGTSSASLAQAYANNAYALMQLDPAGYVASATVVAAPLNKPPAAWQPSALQPNATPDAIAAIAQSFVGSAWNMDGCWVLASTIAAEAGAALPVQSTEVGTPGHANGEWTVLYNGPSSASPNWQSLVSTGDVVSFVTGSGGGHITTCVSGSGSTARLIDNITYENPDGTIYNAAHDGSPNDILVASAHAASQEWAGVAPANVVIYGLDTPSVTDLAATGKDVLGTRLALSTLFRATDPAGHAITEYQAYDTLSGATLSTGAAGSATAPATFTSLSATLAYTQAGTDTVDIRAFNGSYWGDWQSATVTVAAPSPTPPVLASQTANQLWLQGKAVALTLPTTLFTDPQHQTLKYTATGLHGTALPTWLMFNPATLTFSGTVPSGTIGPLGITITATDSAGLSASETFTATIPAAAPALVSQTPTQAWAEGGHIVDTLPTGIFKDPQGQALTLRASLSTGAPLPSWLTFNGTSFLGTDPLTAETLALKLTATDTSGLSTSELITAIIAKAGAGLALTEPPMWTALPNSHAHDHIMPLWTHT